MGDLMKVRVISKSKNAVKFEISDTNPAYANTLRRAILNHVPVLAVDKIRVTKNTSALYNEIIAHRIGLVPLTFEADAIKEGETVTLSIKKAGPGLVLAGDMVSSDDSVKAVDPKIPIAKLHKNQELEAECIARLGAGGEHARFQAAIVGYQYKGEKDPNTIIMTVESISGLTPQQIVERAAQIVVEQLETIRKQL